MQWSNVQRQETSNDPQNSTEEKKRFEYHKSVAGSTSGTFRVTLFTIPWIGHE